MLTYFSEKPDKVTVEKLPNRMLFVALNDDIKVSEQQPFDVETVQWQADQHTLTVPDLPGLAGRIEQNFDAWLERAKRENVRPPDPMEQMRADVDFIMVMDDLM